MSKRSLLVHFAHCGCCYGVYHYFTYQGCVRRYCSESPLVFPWTKGSKVAYKATYGNSTSQCRQQARATLRAESLLILRILTCKLTHLSAYVLYIQYMGYIQTHDSVLCTYIAPRVMHFSAFSINPRRTCAGGLWYLSCVCVCQCVCLLPLNRQRHSFLRLTKVRTAVFLAHLHIGFLSP